MYHQLVTRSVCVCVFYLVAVYGVLRRPGGDGDGVWLAAAVALTVSVLASLPEQTPEKNNYTFNPLCSHCFKQRTEIDISVTIVQSRCCIHMRGRIPHILHSLVWTKVVI